MSTLLTEPAIDDVADREIVGIASLVAAGLPKRSLGTRRLSGWQIVQLCLWTALAVSTWDVAILALRRFAWSQFLFAGDHILWTTTVAHVVAMLLIGLPLVIAARTGSSFATIRPVTFLFTFAAAWSLLAPVPGLVTVAEVMLSLGIATQLSKFAERHAHGLCRLTNRTWPVMAAGHLLVVGGIVGSGWVAERNGLAALAPAPTDAPNVLLVVLDTVGYDALNLGEPNATGVPQAHTPNLANFAARGVSFRRAISTAPWTLPAHASMLSGQPAHQHLATWHRPPAEPFETLAERLQSAGYLTGGFIGNNIYCGRETGIAGGFLHYEDYPLTITRVLQSTPLGRWVLEVAKRGRIDRVERKSADDVTEPFLAWLDGHEAGQADGRPFFAFLNYFDAHDPYVAPPDYAGQVPHEAADRVAIRDWWHIDKLSLTDQQIALGLYGYLDCVTYLDHHFGQLLDSLRDRGVLDNTIVIVTSDHGEHFGDHGLFGHGNSLYQPLVHVPLLVVFPERVPAETKVDQTVSVVDLPATVLELTGVDDSPLPGHSLSRHWKGGAATSTEPVVAELVGPSAFPPNHGASPIFGGPMRAVFDGGFKYIRAGDVEELFDLDRDPREERNLVGEAGHGETLERLRELAGSPGR